MLSENFIGVPLEFSESQGFVSLNIVDIPYGASQTPDFLVYRDGNSIRVFDRICDHRGGKLHLNKDNIAICPMHNWHFDSKTGSYLNVDCRKRAILELMVEEIEFETVEVPVIKKQILLPLFTEKYQIDFFFVNHACFIITISDHSGDKLLKFATDPWILGPAFSNGWWLKRRRLERQSKS